MAAPLSDDLRERVVGAIEGGESCRSAAAHFGVAVSSVVKWHQCYRATGLVTPGKMGGHRKRILEPHRSFIVERVNQTSHLTLHGLKDELAARGVPPLGGSRELRRVHRWSSFGDRAQDGLANGRAGRP